MDATFDDITNDFYAEVSKRGRSRGITGHIVPILFDCHGF